MQQDSNKKKGKGYRVRPAFARERLNGRTRRVCSILGLAAVVLASAVVVHSLYVIQIRDGAKYRQYAAQQQLLDTTVKATRGEIYDANGITLASTSVVWNIWADPSYSSILYTTSTNDDKTTVRTFDPTMCAEVSQGPAAALRRRRESGRGGHFLGGIYPAIPDRVRCTVQN